MKRTNDKRVSDEALANVEARLDYVFSNKSLLRRALTHKSSGDGQKGFEHNERLEWLGDRVLGLLAAELLYQAWPNEDEGTLTKRFHTIVSGFNCAQAARHLHLYDILSVSKGLSVAQVQVNDSMLGDAYEAIMAALYLDGGIDAARPLFELAMKMAGSEPLGNSKNRLQEWAQARGLPVPEYKLLDRQGPDHAPMFHVAVAVAGQEAMAHGGSKQQAEQSAAQALLDILR